MGDGTEGRGPSLHMDASASILRPLSPYGPGGRGLPSFPRLSVLRCCGSSDEQGNKVLRIRGTGGGQPSLRSGPSSFQHLVTAPDRPPRAQAVTGNGCPIARVDRPVPSECHWHSSMHPTRGTKNNAFSSLSFPLNPVIMCWRDFDSYLIMNHSFSCIEKRAHLMICPPSGSSAALRR